MAKRTLRKEDATANRGFEPTLWADFEVLRNSRVAAKYRHFVLSLIFLKQGN
jgi:hypothetical protein